MGYLTVDHRGAGGKLEEYDTVSCKHCQTVIKVVRRQREGAWCMTCAGPVCFKCAETEECTPFMKKIERWQRRQKFYRNLGI